MIGISLLRLERKQALPHTGKVEPRLPEPGSNEGDLVVTRDIEVENAIVGIDGFLDPRGVLGLFRRTRIEERQDLHPGSGDNHVAYLRMRDREDLPGVPPRCFYQRDS